MAAGRTVEHGRVHSLHSYFLRPGDPTVPILYEVDRIRDGRSFTTRRVVAVQHGRAIFNLVGLLPRPRGGPGAPVPHARGARPRVAGPALRAPGALEGGAGRVVRPAPPDRPAPHRRPPLALAGRWASPTSGSGSGPTASCPTTRCCTPAWPPTPPTCPSSTPSSPRTRRAGTTRTSWAPAWTTACGSTSPSGPTSGCSTTRTRPIAAQGRGLARGFLFDRQGRLCVSLAQEGLVRMRTRTSAVSQRIQRSPSGCSRAARSRCRAGAAGRSSSPGRASPASGPASPRCGEWRRARGTSRAGSPWPGR